MGEFVSLIVCHFPNWNFTPKLRIIYQKTWLTSPLWVQNIPGGGSGSCFTIHVKFIVESVSMYKSGPPIIVVIGSIWRKKKKRKTDLLKRQS